MSNSSVFELGQDPNSKPRHYLKRKMAKDLVARGLAKQLLPHAVAIQMLTKPEKSGGIRSRQGRIYEAAATQKIGLNIPLQGGLTRTETQPRIIPAFTGARVGHQ